MNVLAAKPDPLMGWMESLGDQKRLRLLRLLERQELGVAELCDILQLPQSTISRHLKLLAEKRWIRSRRHGTTHLYRMILDELDPAARRLWLLARQRTEEWNDIRQDEMRLVQTLRQRQSRGQRFFAASAEHWDQLRMELYGQGFVSAALLGLLPRQMVVADLGCGTGAMAAQLAPHVAGVIGVDNSAAMLKAARSRTAQWAHAEIRQGDIQAAPIEDAACDAALLLLVLTYVSDIPTVLREAARILKPGGSMVIVDLLPHDREEFRRQMGQVSAGLDPKALQRQLEEIGFSTDIQPLPTEPNVKGPALFAATARRI
jgi:ArsR family transcriptional regulator